MVGWGASLAASALGRSWDSRPDDAFFRLRYRSHGHENVLPTIAHVDLTDSVTRELGMKGGDRQVYARLVNVLSRAGAASAIFDIIFPLEGTTPWDAAFATAARESGMVVTPVVLSPASYKALTEASDDVSPALICHPRVIRPWHAADCRFGDSELRGTFIRLT